MFDKEEALEKEELIMEAVCDLCKWPGIYEGEFEEDLYENRCDSCPAAEAVRKALGLERE